MFAVLVLAGTAQAAGAPDDCAVLVEEAEARGLSDDPYWRTLLHVRKGWFGEQSLMDDPSFFLAPDGAADPGAEMEAELRALCESPPPEPDRAPWCRFPARYAWLAGQLGLDPGRVAPDRCPALSEALEAMDPGGATLVFPAAHGGNPASMFGHTLIRIDPASGSSLLAHAVNFAARTDPNDLAVVYAFKGLSGLYPGYYTLQPYYEKVLQYADIEQRDVWEYRLNLTAQEARTLALHAWELRDRYAAYYYLDENCSYQILFLLEAARSGVRLTDRYPAWVTPLDTVEDVLAEGLVREVVYRPSLVRRLEALGKTLDGEAIDAIRALASGAAAPEDVPGEAGRRARILEAAAELVRIEYVRGDLDREAYRRRYLPLLAARSRTGVPAEEPRVPRPPAPHEGHASSRVRFSAGAAGGAPWLGLGIRPSYHGLDDPVAGYEPGSAIGFLETEVGFLPERGRLRLTRLELVRIVSLEPWGAFFRPWSWSVQAGFVRRPAVAGDGTRLGVGGFAAGVSVAPAEGVLLYTMGLAEGVVSGGRDTGWGIGGGVDAGLLWQPPLRWSAGVRGRFTGYVPVPARPGWRAEVWITRGLSRRAALQGRVVREAWDGEHDTRWEVAWMWFY